MRISRAALLAFGVFCMSMSIQMAYVLLPGFIDEVDNILGGIEISRGSIPYVDFYSQHTPLLYYFNSIPGFFDLHSAAASRGFFYGALSLAAAGFFLRYHRSLGTLVAIVAPLIYFASHPGNPELSFTMLSDQVQAVAYLFLIAEFSAVLINRSCRLDTWAVVSIASFVSIGVALVSIYFVVASVAGILVLQCLNLRDDHSGFADWFQAAIRCALKASGILLLPFLIFGIFALVSGFLPQMIDQAYFLNRITYSKYIGGFGSDPAAPLAHFYQDFVPMITRYFDYIAIHPITGLRHLLNPVGLILLVLIVAWRRIAAAPFLVTILSLSAIRGWEGFHAQPYWAVSGFAIAVVFFSGPTSLFSVWKLPALKFIQYIAGASALIILFTPYVKFVNGTLDGPAFVYDLAHLTTPPSIKAEILDAALVGDEGFTDTSLDVGIFLETNRMPSGGVGGIVPWFAEVYESDMIDKLTASRPAIIFHNPNNAVWGHALKDYAPNLNEFILENYEPIVDSNGNSLFDVYVRNDIVERVVPNLSNSLPDQFGGAIH